MLLAALYGPLNIATADTLPSGRFSVGPQVVDDWIDEDAWFSTHRLGESALPAVAISSAAITTAEDAAGGCDGVKTGHCGFHVASNELNPWWQVDLGQAVNLDRIVVFNRTDGQTAGRTRRLRILVSTEDHPRNFVEVYRHDGSIFYGVNEDRPLVVKFHDRDVVARFVRLMVPGRCSFALDEVEVYPSDNPARNIALNRPADQISTSPYSRAEIRPALASGSTAAATTGRANRFSWKHIETVLERGRRLVQRLQFTAGEQHLRSLIAKLDSLDRRLDQSRQQDSSSETDRKRLYLEARFVVRQIAFTNPLLDFDRILFIKRHDPTGLYHMVHQYYGFCQRPGGGLFVLKNPFSSRPVAVDLLAGATVERGPMKGRPLVAGTFLSPDLAFPGNEILFAYTEGRGEGIEWSPRASFHIFRVRTDGTGLTQLTSGRWNDFDPCYLPDGNIVFISERRGGYLRCGGSAPPYDSPTYTLHWMKPDGSDIRCLSFHETHEWHPSVDHHGMLIYTRWDYVDRDTNVAHHIWSCFPDGRDPRSYHGNYPLERSSRPWMEMSCRAVPGSHRFVATAAAHHGNAFGSLVLIDYRPNDDGRLSQVQRITPDVPFPESEGGKSAIRQAMCYGTPWPLSEDDYLCVYDRHAKNRGIYWIDRDGNRELLYRDPEISCLSPIPLRPRPTPPVLPTRTAPSPDSTSPDGPDGQLPFDATVAVMNVYDSDFAWPPETEVAALRVIQVLPKSTPPVDQPRIGIATETNARAVLGTVPVEPDGSAYFKAPAGRPLYFQALDRLGMAVQSMRSATYLHPGERLICQGCHESKHRQADRRTQPPLALLRPPSTIQPEADGSNPFNYPRLVQPVLDRNCAECHRREHALDLSGQIQEPHGWTRSYTNLAPYGFYFNVSNGSIRHGVHGGSRTVVGQFGARAAPLLHYLSAEHHGVRLSAEDRRRVTLWLDCNSEFYGSYEDTRSQSRGEIVAPALY